MPKRVLQGTIVSDKNNKTVVVAVERKIKHPLYKKYIKRTSKFSAHDEANACQVGETVQIEECRPISKNKCWQVIATVDTSTGKVTQMTKMDKPAANDEKTKAKKTTKASAKKKASA